MHSLVASRSTVGDDRRTFGFDGRFLLCISQVVRPVLLKALHPPFSHVTQFGSDSWNEGDFSENSSRLPNAPTDGGICTHHRHAHWETGTTSLKSQAVTSP